MEIRLEVKEVKAMFERLKKEEKQSAITNVRLSEEATQWVKEHKYAMKEYEGIVALAESEEKLPSNEEIEILKTFEKAKEEGALLELLLACLLAKTIL